MATAGALLPLASAQGAAESTQDRKAGIYDTGLRMAYGKFTATVAGTSPTALHLMFTLPPGRIILYKHLSYLSSTAGVSTANISIGHGAYVNQDGTVVPANSDLWVDAADAGSAINLLFSASGAVANGILAAAEYNSKSGIPVVLDVDTEDISIGDTVEVGICYCKEGSA